MRLEAVDAIVDRGAILELERVGPLGPGQDTAAPIYMLAADVDVIVPPFTQLSDTTSGERAPTNWSRSSAILRIFRADSERVAA